MANTFPIHLENQLVALYSLYVQRLARAISAPLVRKFEQENPELATDDLKDDIAGLPDKVEKKDPSTVGPIVTIGAIIIPKFMFDGINRTMKQVDAWSFERMRQEALVLERTRRTTGLAQLIQESNLATEQSLLKSVTRNAGLIKNIQKEETLAISEQVRIAVRNRLSSKELKKNILKAVNTTDSKASFWARDQISKVSSDLNFDRLDSAGFPAYKWNTSRDGRVRPDHIWREGRVFVKGQTDINPGDDPNCRCTPSPAFGESDASSEPERRKTLTAINKDRRTVNGLKKNENKKPLEILGKEALDIPAEKVA